MAIGHWFQEAISYIGNKGHIVEIQSGPSQWLRLILDSLKLLFLQAFQATSFFADSTN